MSNKDKRRKWILSLGFSEAEADEWIEFGTPDRKILALHEVLHKPKPEVEPEPAPEPKPEPVEPDKIPAGMFWCTKCKALHRETSNIGQKHLKHKEQE